MLMKMKVTAYWPARTEQLIIDYIDDLSPTFSHNGSTYELVGIENYNWIYGKLTAPTGEKGRFTMRPA